MKNKIVFVVFFLISLVSLKTLLNPGLFTAHDIWHNLARLIYYKDALDIGQIPPYYLSNIADGFGYPLFMFSYHLPFAIGFILLKAGWGFDVSLKILYFLSFFASGLSMYFFARDLFYSRLAAFLCALSYLWVPYHFLVLLVSASLGISFAFVFIPLIFWGVYKIAKDVDKKDRNNYGNIILSLGFACLVLSHLPSLIVILPALFVFFVSILFNLSNTKKLLFVKKLFKPFLTGIFISAFYLIPTLFYSQNLKGLPQIYETGFLNIKELLYSTWGYGIITTNVFDSDLSFQLGIANWVAIVTTILIILFGKFKQKIILSGILLSLIISLTLTLPVSKMVWQLFYPIFKVDFPFRFLLPAVFLGSLLIGYSYKHLKFLKGFYFLLIVFVVLYTNRNHINVNMHILPPYDSFVAGENTTSSYNEFFPKISDGGIVNIKWETPVSDNVRFFEERHNPTESIYTVSTKNEETVTINKYYYPFLETYLDNQKAISGVDKTGRINVKIPPGKHDIKIKFIQTPPIIIGIFLTFLGIGILGYDFVIFSKRTKSTSKSSEE